MNTVSLTSLIIFLFSFRAKGCHIPFTVFIAGVLSFPSYDPKRALFFHHLLGFFIDHSQELFYSLVKDDSVMEGGKAQHWYRDDTSDCFRVTMHLVIGHKLQPCLVNILLINPSDI